MHVQHLRFSIGLAVLCAGLAGCTQFEPFQRQGAWHQNDAPMHNIAAELANPRDLYRGTGDPVLTGTFATSAIGSIADGGAAGAAAGTTSSGGDNTSGASSASGTASGLGGAAGASSGATGITGGSM